MTEIRYYPLINCDSEGTEKVAMIPTPDGNTVKSRSGMWLEEMIPHHFRLYTQNSSFDDPFNIRCPRCGSALKRISRSTNEAKHGLYVCSACTKK